jgi:hypothetical protein
MTGIVLPLAADYLRRSLRRSALVVLGVGLLGAAFVLDLAIGPGPATRMDVVGALVRPGSGDARLQVVAHTFIAKLAGASRPAR